MNKDTIQTNNKIQSHKGIVFFDIDGTLVDERSGIYDPTEMTLQAVEKLKQNGYLVGVATGRAKCYVPDFGIDFDCYVTSNGAVAELDGKIIANNQISKDKVDFLLEYLNKNDMAYYGESYDRCYFSENNYEILLEMLEKYNIHPKRVDKLKDAKEINVNKFICVFKKHDMFEGIKKDLSEYFVVTRHHNNNSADIDLKGMNKAVGISEVIKYLNFDIKDTYAIGDDGNDIDMLKTVGCGIAMTPHADALEEVADMYTCSVKEEGIYKALEKLELI